MFEEFAQNLRTMVASSSMPTPSNITSFNATSIASRGPQRAASVSLSGFQRNSPTTIPLPPSTPETSTTLWGLILNQLYMLPGADLDTTELYAALIYLYPPIRDPDMLIISLSQRKYIRTSLE